MSKYKNEDIREFFNISKETVRRYALDFGEFLSEGATPERPGLHRVYNDSDLRVFGVIASMKNSNHSDADIKATLQAGGEGDIPDLLKDDKVTLSPHIQNRLANQHIDNLQTQLNDVIEEAQMWRDKAHKLEGQLAQIENLGSTIDLHKKIARLELLLEIAKGNSNL